MWDCKLADNIPASVSVTQESDSLSLLGSSMISIFVKSVDTNKYVGQAKL